MFWELRNPSGAPGGVDFSMLGSPKWTLGTQFEDILGDTSRSAHPGGPVRGSSFRASRIDFFPISALVRCFVSFSFPSSALMIVPSLACTVPRQAPRQASEDARKGVMHDSFSSSVLMTIPHLACMVPRHIEFLLCPHDSSFLGLYGASSSISSSI